MVKLKLFKIWATVRVDTDYETYIWAPDEEAANEIAQQGFQPHEVIENSEPDADDLADGYWYTQVNRDFPSGEFVIQDIEDVGQEREADEYDMDFDLG